AHGLTFDLLPLDFLWRAVCFDVAASPQISTLSLHDALPISSEPAPLPRVGHHQRELRGVARFAPHVARDADLHQLAAAGLLDQRSEEHTSELQSRENLVCRLLLEKKKRAWQAMRSPPCSTTP